MKIRLFATGGTIDAESIEEGNNYVFGETHVPAMLEQARSKVVISVEVLFLKDSLYTTDADREHILQKCIQCPEDRIVITHGTDTMTDTAQVLGNKVKNKVIVLLGAMVPFNQPNTDALFNLGCAISSVQLLSPGVYITMNGQIFNGDNVRKNKEKKVFESI